MGFNLFSGMMWAFDIIYVIDVTTMIIYKSIKWNDMKQIFPPRSIGILILEGITCLPVSQAYWILTKNQDLVFFVLRLRYVFRLVRLCLYLRRIKTQVGLNPFITVANELIMVMAIFVLLVSLILYILMYEEGYLQKSYIETIYYTISKLSGKGVPIQENTPHKALIPLLIFIFVAYMATVYYISGFITAIMHTMKSKFYYIYSYQRTIGVLRTRKYQSSQMNSTVSN